MPTPSRGAATNRPDTSPKAVASVIRGLLAQIDRMAPTLEEYDYTPEECQAPDCNARLFNGPLGECQCAVSQPAFQFALTKDEWAERVERAYARMWEQGANPADYEVAAALRAAFPELAPSDD